MGADFYAKNFFHSRSDALNAGIAKLQNLSRVGEDDMVVLAVELAFFKISVSTAKLVLALHVALQ